MKARGVVVALILAGFVHAQEGDEVFALVKEQLILAEKNLRAMQKCLQNAGTLAQANSCEGVFAQVSGGEPELFTHWNEALKDEALKDLNYYLDTVVPCVKKAKTMEELSICAPDEN